MTAAAFRLIGVLAVASAVTAGCSSDASDQTPTTTTAAARAPSTTAPVTRGSLSETTLGRLVVSQRFTGEGQSDEGSLTFVELRDPTGELVLAATIASQYPGPQEIVDAELASGPYQLTVTNRGCAGSCEFLDPPSSRCVAEIDVPDGRLDVTLEVARPCRVS